MSFTPEADVEENYRLMHEAGESWESLAAGADRADVPELAKWLRAKAPAKAAAPKDRGVPDKQTARR